jgi:hypothetical protein
MGEDFMKLYSTILFASLAMVFWLAGGIASPAVAQTFKTQLKPAAGVSDVPLFSSSSGNNEVDTAPASALNGRFNVFKIADNGMIGIIYNGRRVWVDSFDVETPELGPKQRDCIVIASRMAAPSQSSRGLGDKCK